MVVELATFAALQDGDGTIADIVVELLERPIHDAFRLRPLAALRQHGFEDACQKESLEKLGVALMSKQHGVGKRAIGL